MNATKFVVLLIFVGVVCANVGAKQLEEVSKEIKCGISIPKTTSSNGIGAELDSVTATTSAENSEYSNTNIAAGPGGPTADASGSVYKSTLGSVTAEGPNASASSSSTAYGTAGSSAAGDANADGNANSVVSGSTGP